MRLIYTIAAADLATAQSALDVAGFGATNFATPLVNSADANDDPPRQYASNVNFMAGQQAVWETALSDASVAFTSFNEGSYQDQLKDATKGFGALLTRMSWKRQIVDDA